MMFPIELLPSVVGWCLFFVIVTGFGRAAAVGLQRMARAIQLLRRRKMARIMSVPHGALYQQWEYRLRIALWTCVAHGGSKAGRR